MPMLPGFITAVENSLSWPLFGSLVKSQNFDGKEKSSSSRRANHEE